MRLPARASSPRTQSRRTANSRSAPGDGAFWPLFALAGLWAIAPLLPALLAGDLPGSPYTDLYPSVWGLDWFASAQPGFPTWTTTIAAPTGMPFYYSSPLHGWLGAPFCRLGGAVLAYVVTLVMARLATIGCAYGALRALGASGWGALAGALVFGASPFFQGYAVEGIIEGTDGWTLALWVWAVARERRVAAALAFALTIASSWYLGMVVCALAFAWGLRRRLAWGSAAAGLVLASPLLWAFLLAARGASPLPDDIRVAMGAPLSLRPPGILSGENGFALTTWIGLSMPLLALPSARRHWGWALGAVVFFVLSTGRGPWYDLPVLESVRFPYRWHAGTIWCLGRLVAASVDRWKLRPLALIPLLEGVFFSPIEAILPRAPTEVPALYDQVTGPLLLELPGPVALPPGEINPSRPRAKYLLFFQLHHRAASPWAPDFNGIAATPAAPWLTGFAAWDPVVTRGALVSPPPVLDLEGARGAGVRQIMVHRKELGGRAPALEEALRGLGATLQADDGALGLYRMP